MLTQLKDFVIIQTGGQCEAFYRPIGHDNYLLITDSEEARLPDAGGFVTVGVYDEDSGDCIAIETQSSMALGLEWAAKQKQLYGSVED